MEPFGGQAIDHRIVGLAGAEVVDRHRVAPHLIDELVGKPAILREVIGQALAGSGQHFGLVQALVGPVDHVEHRRRPRREILACGRGRRPARAPPRTLRRADEAGEQPKVRIHHLEQQARPVGVRTAPDEAADRRCLLSQGPDPDEPAVQALRDARRKLRPLPAIRLRQLDLTDDRPIAHVQFGSGQRMLRRRRRALLGEKPERDLHVQLHVPGVVVGIGPREQSLDQLHQMKVHYRPLAFDLRLLAGTAAASAGAPADYAARRIDPTALPNGRSRRCRRLRPPHHVPTVRRLVPCHRRTSRPPPPTSPSA